MGLDPASPSFSNGPRVRFEGGRLKLTYPRNLQAAGVGYRVSWSTDLETWTEVGLTEVVIGENGAIRVIEASVPDDSGTSKFIRLEIFNL